jgi:hypothetical protein
MRRATPQQAFIHFHCRVSEKGLDPVPWRLEPGRVADCYLGLPLPPGPAGELEAGTVLVVAPAALLHPRVPQPDGSLIYELLTTPNGSPVSWCLPPT